MQKDEIKKPLNICIRTTGDSSGAHPAQARLSLYLSGTATYDGKDYKYPWKYIMYTRSSNITKTTIYNATYSSGTTMSKNVQYEISPPNNGEFALICVRGTSAQHGYGYFTLYN